jgi:hypothetical protein
MLRWAEAAGCWGEHARMRSRLLEQLAAALRVVAEDARRGGGRANHDPAHAGTICIAHDEARHELLQEALRCERLALSSMALVYGGHDAYDIG